MSDTHKGCNSEVKIREISNLCFQEAFVSEWFGKTVAAHVGSLSSEEKEVKFQRRHHGPDTLECRLIAWLTGTISWYHCDNDWLPDWLPLTIRLMVDYLIDCS